MSSGSRFQLILNLDHELRKLYTLLTVYLLDLNVYMYVSVDVILILTCLMCLKLVSCGSKLGLVFIAFEYSVFSDSIRVDEVVK